MGKCNVLLCMRQALTHPPLSTTMPSNIASNISDWHHNCFDLASEISSFQASFGGGYKTEEVNQEDHNRNWGGEPISHWSTSCVCLLRSKIIQRLHYRSEQIAPFSCTKKLYSIKTTINCCVTKLVIKGPNVFFVTIKDQMYVWWFSLNLCSSPFGLYDACTPFQSTLYL